MVSLRAAIAVELVGREADQLLAAIAAPSPSAQPFEARRPMTDIIVWLLPEPDSPTMATVSPALDVEIDALDRVEHRRRRVRKRTLQVADREDGRSSAISAILRVEGVAQAVADEVQAEQGRDEEDRRDRSASRWRPGCSWRPRRSARPRLVMRLLHAEAEEGEEAFEQDDLRHEQRHVDDDRAERVGDDVAADDAPRRRRRAPRPPARIPAA